MELSVDSDASGCGCHHPAEQTRGTPPERPTISVSLRILVCMANPSSKVNTKRNRTSSVNQEIVDKLQVLPAVFFSCVTQMFTVLLVPLKKPSLVALAMRSVCAGDERKLRKTAKCDYIPLAVVFLGTARSTSHREK